MKTRIATVHTLCSWCVVRHTLPGQKYVALSRTQACSICWNYGAQVSTDFPWLPNEEPVALPKGEIICIRCGKHHQESGHCSCRPKLKQLDTYLALHRQLPIEAAFYALGSGLVEPTEARLNFVQNAALHPEFDVECPRCKDHIARLAIDVSEGNYEVECRRCDDLHK